jgi:arsenate reductase-like glutaredoxin family protein
MRLVKACSSVNAMAELLVYEKRTCSTCRNLTALLEERRIEFDRSDLDRAEQLDMEVDMELMQRPVVVRGDRAVLARPVERVDELVD